MESDLIFYLRVLACVLVVILLALEINTQVNFFRAIKLRREIASLERKVAKIKSDLDERLKNESSKKHNFKD